MLVCFFCTTTYEKSPKVSFSRNLSERKAVVTIPEFFDTVCLIVQVYSEHLISMIAKSKHLSQDLYHYTLVTLFSYKFAHHTNTRLKRY